MSKYLQIMVRVPHDVTIKEATDYVSNAIKYDGGSKHPEDPLFNGLEVVEIKTVKAAPPTG